MDFERCTDEELALDEIKKIAAYLDKLVWLDISGGEPFLRDDLPDIIAAFDAKTISIPTNSFDPTLIRNEVKKVRSVTEAEINIAVSIDGFRETNDIIRSKGYFDKSIETIDLLKSLNNVRVKVNTVLCNENYGEIIDFMRFIRSLDVDFHSIIFRRGPINASMPNFERPSYEKLLQIKKAVFEIWDSYDYGFKSIEKNILKNYQRCMYETSLKIIKEHKQLPACLAGRTHLVVYANGDCAFCEMLEPFGNLKNRDIKEVLGSEEANAQRRHIKERKCHCHHNCNMIDNYFLNPFKYPKLLTGIGKP